MIKEKLRNTGIEITDEQEAQLDQFVELLISENKKFNLTAIREKEAIVEKHVVDSLAIVKVAELNKGLRVIDIGSGAGIPGLILKVVFPKIEVALVDSAKKKVEFIKLAVNQLGLEGAICVADRAENMGKNASFREQFDFAIARAVKNTSILAEYLLPFLKLQGRAIMYKGKDPEAELAEAATAIELLGGGNAKIEKFKLNEDARSFIVIEKLKNTPLEYPRKPGLPEKRPLR